MKKYALAACSTLAVMILVQLKGTASPYHADNIVLKTFQAIQAQGGARVTWEFTSEELDVTCTLEKSGDGINFSPLRSFRIASTRQQSLHTYLDKQAVGPTFYRLRITKEAFIPYISPIVSVNLQHTAANYVGQPVTIGMSSENFFGELAVQDKVMCVRLVNINGQAKLKQYVKGTDLERIFRPSFSRMPTGYYVLKINDTHDQPLMNKCIYKF